MTVHSPFNKPFPETQVNDINPYEFVPPAQVVAPVGHAKHYPPYLKYPVSHDAA